MKGRLLLFMLLAVVATIVAIPPTLSHAEHAIVYADQNAWITSLDKPQDAGVSSWRLAARENVIAATTVAGTAAAGTLQKTHAYPFWARGHWPTHRYHLLFRLPGRRR